MFLSSDPAQVVPRHTHAHTHCVRIYTHLKQDAKHTFSWRLSLTTYSLHIQKEKEAESIR